jgi:DNA-binding NarL/FixJ family response regulator
MRVLIVDDNYSYRQSLRELFSQQFADVLVMEAESPEEALEQVKKAVPDFLLIDIDLAGQSGLGLTRKVREELRGAYIAVITSHDLPEFRQAAEESGADYFFSKASSDIEDMLAWVEAASLKISIP